MTREATCPMCDGELREGDCSACGGAGTLPILDLPSLRAATPPALDVAIAAINEHADIRLPDGRLAIARDHAVEVLRAALSTGDETIVMAAASKQL